MRGPALQISSASVNTSAHGAGHFQNSGRGRGLAAQSGYSAGGTRALSRGTRTGRTAARQPSAGPTSSRSGAGRGGVYSTAGSGTTRAPSNHDAVPSSASRRSSPVPGTIVLQSPNSPNSQMRAAGAAAAASGQSSVATPLNSAVLGSLSGSTLASHASGNVGTQQQGGSAPQSPLMSQRCSPATPSRSEWRGTRVSPQSSTSRPSGYPITGSKQTPNLDSHRTPAAPSAPSNGMRPGLNRRAAASPGGSGVASSRLPRSPGDRGQGNSSGVSSARGNHAPTSTPSSMMRATPKAQHRKVASAEEAGHQNHQAVSSESVSGRTDGRGGPILEESNLLINIKAPARDGQPASQGLHSPHSAEPVPETREKQNFVARFYKEGRRRDWAMAPRMDVVQYWEKRRVQNVMRRVLEAVQERFGLDSDAQPGDLGAVFDHLCQQAGLRGGTADEGVAESPFINALNAVGLWPPELSHEDRSEIFHALLVPTHAHAKTVISEQAQLRTMLTRRLFKDGFECVPFNLPDFPVPTHLLSSNVQLPVEKFTVEQRNAVAEAVATTFRLDQTGLDRTKDFFVCGLLSLEEIQMGLSSGLPQLLPTGVVEDAVVRVISRGAPLMTSQEWHDLVLAVRTPQACGQVQEEPCEEPRVQEEPCEEPSPLSQSPANMSFQTPGPSPSPQSPLPTTANNSLFAEPSTPALPSLASPVLEHRDLSVNEGDGAQTDRFRGRFEPVTEPLPCRTLLSEDPISFRTGGSPTRVVDWNTAVLPTSSPDRRVSSGGSSTAVGHQADEGAGARLSWGTSGFKQELASVVSKAAGEASGTMPGGADPVAWINIDLHHECGGPYLARAFVRCCQLYAESLTRGQLYTESLSRRRGDTLSITVPRAAG